MEYADAYTDAENPAENLSGVCAVMHLGRVYTAVEET